MEDEITFSPDFYVPKYRSSDAFPEPDFFSLFCFCYHHPIVFLFLSHLGVTISTLTGKTEDRTWLSSKGTHPVITAVIDDPENC